MVLAASFQGVDAYRCEACGFHYADKARAERCEAFCREHNACNSAITEQALEQRD